MEQPTASLQPQPLIATTRHFQNPFTSFHQSQSHQDSTAFVSQLDPSLHGLDAGDTFSQHFDTQLGDPNHGQSMQVENGFSQPSTLPARFQESLPQTDSTRQQLNSSSRQTGQFGVLTPQTVPHNYIQHDALERLQQGNELLGINGSGGQKIEGHFVNMKMVPNPPNLQAWRERLFNVNEIITLSEDDFLTYFPHVDNIYSHRSTQRYKRKPFVSHYWDCRLKGRPPGTPKSDDPTKKKRKRQARERDLCDVKIKITEYFSGARAMLGTELNNTTDDGEGMFSAREQFGSSLQNGQQSQTFGLISSADGNLSDLPGSNGERFYTIQRVNGNGGNGKGDGVAGPHKHTLEESDRVKKNSLQRQLLKEEKENKKMQASKQKTYHKKATGIALNTVKRHSKDHELKLFGSCFCPFVQRVWIALEVKKIEYQYIEVDPYKKPESLLEVNPLGLVPALRHGDWACHESTVLLEYLEDLNVGDPLLPIGDPQARAHCRLWADHVNRKLVPAFYHYLQAQEAPKQVENAGELKRETTKLVNAAHPDGPFFLGTTISWVDIQLAPWLLRFRRVLKPYRGWPDPEEGSRWAKWVDAIESNPYVKATTSTDDLYLDSYERYAENRPNTSQVANAVNSGRGLP